MPELEKYRGIIPAFYACYDDEGNISPERIEALAKYYLEIGVKGLYVGGSSKKTCPGSRYEGSRRRYDNHRSYCCSLN